MSLPLRILIVTDSFPPVCGGSGWSTWELTRGLIGRGHHVEVVKVETRTPVQRITDRLYEGVRVTHYRRPATNVPFVRNLVKNERLWSELTSYLTARLRAERFDIVHGQHVMTTVPAIRAAAIAGTPAVATVRDYWPVCYWSDLIFDPASPTLCPGCTALMMTRCVRPRAGAAAPAAWPLIPYMRRNLRTKRTTLAQADAVIAVSHAIAGDLRARAPELANTPLYTIPNPVDLAPLDDAFAYAPRLMEEPYVLYAGKLATNKGVQFLPQALQQAHLAMPLVVAGDGPLRAGLESDARARGLRVQVLGWINRSETLAWMRHAAVLAFPSYGPESLSRVLLEASALGVPIAAMDTGGTRDIVQPDVTGLLSATPDQFARDLSRLAADEPLRRRLGAAARADVRQRFAAASVVERVEQVYRSLLLPRAA
jgi:glycosyltransferase involved in cell wall biosynthesis